MSLAEHLANGTVHQGLPCSIEVLLTDLPPDEAAELRKYLADPSITHTALERAIKADGHYVGVGTVGKHRRGDCRCEK